LDLDFHSIVREQEPFERRKRFCSWRVVGSKLVRVVLEFDLTGVRFFARAVVELGPSFGANQRDASRARGLRTRLGASAPSRVSVDTAARVNMSRP